MKGITPPNIKASYTANVINSVILVEEQKINKPEHKTPEIYSCKYDQWFLNKSANLCNSFFHKWY